MTDLEYLKKYLDPSKLEEGISLRSYAQENPLISYTKEGFWLFDEMLDIIDKEITTYLLKAEVRQKSERKKVADKTSTNEVKEKNGKQQPKNAHLKGQNKPTEVISEKWPETGLLNKDF